MDYTPEAAASSLPSGLADDTSRCHCLRKKPSKERRRKDLMTPQSSFKAPEEPANESQLTQLKTRLKYRGPNVSRLDPDQKTQKEVLNCVRWGFMSSAADSQSKMDSILLPSH